ncbi:MAG: Asp-tRNA(Asn)/Glu-tRNA(Gln) amidotransferase subunit GatC [Clostridia bacterium]|nr:Asp-tRNA(Asn)/Glu-tRNA(Gln) amidotransferase subunit GatC [Clostridia bacterium]
MQISNEELLHIAKLSNLNIKEEELDSYRLNLEDILNFADIVKNASVEGLNETIGANDNYNVFRKDEIKTFEDSEALLQNAPEQERGMFKIPKVIQ